MQSYHNQDHEIESPTAIRPQDDLEEELPLDLNPGLATRLSDDYVPRPRLYSPYIANSNHTPAINSNHTSVVDSNNTPAAAPLIFASFLQSLADNAFPNSVIPPRPKPPLPENFFIHPERSWRSMSKQEIQVHIVARFNVRTRYNLAYNAWVTEHNKWVFGVYNLVRAVIKSRRRTAPNNPDAVEGNTTMEDADDAATVLDDADFGSLAATELDSAALRDQDLDGTALTELQTNASADQLERAKRWFISLHKGAEQQSPPNPLLPSLQRQGPKGSFGLSAERQSPRPRPSPSIVLPELAARNLQPNMFLPAPPEIVDDPKTSWSGSSAGESEEEVDESSDSWRIYSDKCSCGYARCHCRAWRLWWDKTLEMLAYVEYVDVLVPPPPGSLPGTAPRLARVPFVKPPLPIKSAQPVRSLHERREDRSKNRSGPYQSLLDYMKRPGSHPYPRLFKRTHLEYWRFDVHESQPESREAMESSNELSNDENTLNEHDKSGDSSEAGLSEGDFNLGLGSDGHDQGIPLAPQTVSGHPSSSRCSALKLQWEGFMEDDLKVPTEYRVPMLTAIIQELEPSCLPIHTELFKHLDVRNRLVHWIAYVQYSCRLSPEIFFLAVNLLDRYLSFTKQPLFGARYDTIAVACLWSAWKFEDTSTAVVPLDTLLMYVEPGKVFRNDVIYAEWTLHQLIQHTMSYVPPILTVRLDLVTTRCIKEMVYIARFLIDISATSVMLVAGRPSVSGSAAVWLARELMGIQGYTRDIVPGVIHGTDYHLTVSAGAYLVDAVLQMPYPLNDSRDHALFYKWAQPVVNNVAGWCQGAFRRVWSGGNVNGFKGFSDRLPILRRLIRSKAIPRFQLRPGPSPDHPLFEACIYTLH